jgi:hypothetical protein
LGDVDQLQLGASGWASFPETIPAQPVNPAACLALKNCHATACPCTILIGNGHPQERKRARAAELQNANFVLQVQHWHSYCWSCCLLRL